jgi:hypothetical protein
MNSWRIEPRGGPQFFIVIVVLGVALLLVLLVTTGDVWPF